MDNSYFPIRLEVHMVLALLALLVFGMQFIRFRKSHHLILAVALPCTLLPYLSDDKTFFYAVGIAEAVALVLAFVLSQTIDRDKTPAVQKEKASDQKVKTVPEDTEV